MHIELHGNRWCTGQRGQYDGHEHDSSQEDEADRDRPPQPEHRPGGHLSRPHRVTVFAGVAIGVSLSALRGQARTAAFADRRCRGVSIGAGSTQAYPHASSPTRSGNSHAQMPCPSHLTMSTTSDSCTSGVMSHDFR